MKTLPDSAFDYLVQLWARAQDREIVSVEKYPADEAKEVREPK